MRKQRISASSRSESAEPDWLVLDEQVEVEITSERETHPIEAALMPEVGAGWRADAPGEQTIRLNFKVPLSLRRIRVVIEEHERARTQQFVLRAALAPEGEWREVARQQFNFSPSGATREQEDYTVDLPAVAALELILVPDISRGEAYASLLQLRVA